MSPSGPAKEAVAALRQGRPASWRQAAPKLDAPGSPPEPDDWASALARAAREGAYLVGDGSVLWWAQDGHGRLEPVAVHHRRAISGDALRTALERGPREADEHWPGQVVRRGAPVRVEHGCWRDLGVQDPEGGSGEPETVRALLVPVLTRDRTVAVIAVMREGGRPRYSLREQILLQRVAARVATAVARPLDGGPQADPGRQDRDEPSWTPPSDWLLEHTAAGTWLADRRGRTTFVNSAMTELLGVPAAALMGRPMADLLDDPPEVVSGVFCMEHERRDRRLVRPDGRELWVAMVSGPLIDREGRRCGTINTALDVTERKRKELALRKELARRERPSAHV